MHRAARTGAGSISSQRRRGHQGNTPSSIGRRKEGRKALRWSGWGSEKAGEHHASFSLLWYKLWYEFRKLLFYWKNIGEGGLHLHRIRGARPGLIEAAASNDGQTEFAVMFTMLAMPLYGPLQVLGAAPIA